MSVLPQEFHTTPGGSLTADVHIAWQPGTPLSQLPSHIAGPSCQYSQTLPARWPLATVNGQDGLIQTATVTDPCYWTTDLPFVYELTGSADGSSLAVGLRNWHAQRSSLWLDGRRVVLRGVHVSAGEVGEGDWSAIREQQLSLVVTDPTAELCWTAARCGVPIVAMIENPDTDVIDTLRQLALCPSLLVALLGIDVLQSAIDPLPSGPLYGLAIRDELASPPSWARCMGILLDERPIHEAVTRRPAVAAVSVRRASQTRDLAR